VNETVTLAKAWNSIAVLSDRREILVVA